MNFQILFLQHENVVHIDNAKEMEAYIMSNETKHNAQSALDRFKYEVADELGVPLKHGYNGDLTSYQNGSVGGYMVKKMIEAQEREMSDR
jgi:hypothetical protein